MNPNAQKIKEYVLEWNKEYVSEWNLDKYGKFSANIHGILTALQTLTEACEFYEQNGAGSEEDWKLDLTTENGNLKGGRHAEEALAQAAKDLGL